MAQSTTKSAFITNLPKIYGGYAGGFLFFVILLAIAEQMGLPNKIIGYAFVFLTIGVYAYIGVLSRTMELSEYYVAGRVVPPVFNGMATGADWMSAASFISMAGGLYLAGYGGLGYVLGWTGGYVLVAVLLAPYLRKFGQFTVPDFLGVRYEGNTARLMGVVVLFCASFTYIVSQCFGIGIITSPTGAALQDILTTLRRRFPLGQAYVHPVPVQGEAATPAIVRALAELPRRAPVDVILLARGGGSIEDLWCFNHESIARAIRACAPA